MESRQVVNETGKSSGLKQKQNETSQTQKKILVTHKKQKNTSFLGKKAENVVKKRSLKSYSPISSRRSLSHDTDRKNFLESYCRRIHAA